MHSEPPSNEGMSPDPRAGSRRDRIWKSGIAVLLVGILVRITSSTIADPDLWGHIRFGQLTRRLGGVTLSDPYSYLSAGHPWINHEWLSEVIFSRVWDSLHTPGLVAMKTLVVLVILLLVFGRLRRAGLGLLRSALILVAVALPAGPGIVTIRPQMFTYLAFVLTLLFLERAEDGDARWLWLVPPLFAAWVNLHGGVLAGLGVLVLWSAARVGLALRAWWRRRRSPERKAAGPAATASGDPAAGAEASADPAASIFADPTRAALVAIGVTIAAAAALLLNPYGVRLPLFLVRTATVPRPEITEWAALPLRSGYGILYVVYTVAAAWTLQRSPLRPRPAILVVLGVVALLPLTALRHLPLYGLALGVLMARDLGAVWGPSHRRAAPRGRAAPWLAAAAALVGLLALGRSVSSFRCIEVHGKGSGLTFPARAVDLLRTSGVRARMAVYFDWGEYAIWKLAPAIRVGMDGRRETVYADSVYDAYEHWQFGTRDWARFLAMGPAQLALVPRDRPVYNLMELDPGWELVYVDRLAAIFAPKGSPLGATLRSLPTPSAPVDGSGLCFP